MDQSILNELKKLLAQEHDKLVRELKTIARPDPHMPGDWDAIYPKFASDQTGSHASRDEEADEVEEYEMRLAAEQSLESRLLEVNRALERVQNKTYGICAACKKLIPLERLHANPAAEFHIEHTA